MKIAYCIPALHYSSGMERVLTVKANYLASHYNYEIHIIITEGHDAPPFFLLDPSIVVHQLGVDFEEMYQSPFLSRIWVYRRKMHSFKRKLNEVLLEIAPDITVSLLRRDINILNEMTDGSIKIGELHFNKKFYRKLPYNHLPSFLNHVIEFFWLKSLVSKLKHLDAFVVLTEEDAEHWTELNNLKVIPNPLSFSTTTHSTCMQKQVIAVGRYVGQKGFDLLIPAWVEVIKEHPDWCLRIYGDGWMRDLLQKQIKDLELDDSCFLEHSVSDIAEKFCESSIFVLSSRFEGFGLVIIEAMSCGLPVVSFDCPCGPKDIISEGVDGFLVPSLDINYMAKKISYLIENEEIRLKMGRQAVLKAQNYSIDIIGEKWKNLFEQLMRI